MSNPNLSNPEKLVNEARLNEYHQTILPYLGGHIECGFTPVGAVIMMSGNEAPKHYLKCDGTVYNIADYPELAAFYARSQGSCNFYGGNGTTTFAVPDLRGEFVRGTGSNSHANQGSGANVGVHQDATTLSKYSTASAGTQHAIIYNSGNRLYPTNFDSEFLSANGTLGLVTLTGASGSTGNTKDLITSRPTNTSVLFCVASKNIYLDARFDYSLEEKVVGTWVDGKTLYQKTVTDTFGTITDGTDSHSAISLPNISNVMVVSGYIETTDGVIQQINDAYGFNTTTNKPYNMRVGYKKSTGELNVMCNRSVFSNGTFYVTIQYTKTTDA